MEELIQKSKDVSLIEGHLDMLYSLCDIENSPYLYGNNNNDIIKIVEKYM